MSESRLGVDLARTWSGLGVTRDEWRCLQSESFADTIFSTYEWADAWAGVMGPTLSYFIVSVRDASGRLVGVAPLYKFQYRLLGVLPLTFLRVVGDYSSGHDYADWLVARDNAKEICGAITEFLRCHGRDWDCLWMPNMAGWGERTPICDSLRESGFHVATRYKDFAYSELPNSITSYLQSLSGNMRSVLKRNAKKMADLGGKVGRCTNKADLDWMLSALFSLHKKRWNTKGEEGTFKRNPKSEAFYHQFSGIALERNWLRLHILHLDGRERAAQIGYIYNNAYHLIQTGLDPDYRENKLGLGNQLRLKVVEELIQEGVVAVDDLGQITPHKKKWGAEERGGFHVFSGRKTIVNRFLFKLNLWPTGRFLVPSGPEPN